MTSRVRLSNSRLQAQIGVVVGRLLKREAMKKMYWQLKRKPGDGNITPSGARLGVKCRGNAEFDAQQEGCDDI